MKERLSGYAYYIWMQEQKKYNKYVDILYKMYNRLISKETIISLYYNYSNWHISKNRLNKLMIIELDKKYRKRKFEEGTCRLIHIGKRR